MRWATRNLRLISEKVRAEMSQFMILRKHHPVISSMFEN